jgi:HK97 gp10 family phage protein
MAEIVHISGLKELDAALSALPKATAKNVLKRTLTKAANIVDAAASENAPENTGKLERSVIVGTRLTRSQREGGPVMQADGSFLSASKGYVAVYVGTALGRGMFTEFGTYKDTAQMWFTRAWESTKDEALATISTTLGTEIEKSAARLAKKAGKL